MTNPTDHELNEVLARVLGLRWGYCPETNEHGYFDSDGNFKYPERTFDPLHDANQMELAEAAIVKTYDIEYVKYVESPAWGCHLWNDKMEREPFIACDIDRKRAFALAVYAWWEGRETGALTTDCFRGHS